MLGRSDGRMSAPTLLLADPHRLVLDALNRVLQCHYAVVGLAENGAELLARALAARPTAIVSELSLPEMDAFQALRRLRLAGIDSRFLALSAHAQVSVAAEAFRAGACAYVLKQDPLEELLAAIEAVLRGQAFISSRLSADPLALLIQGAAGGSRRLTPRQRQVLRMVAEGKTMKEAAALMGISIRTAETYKYDLMRRRGLRSNAELVQYAIRLGLLALPPLDLAA